jgi:hypothetical protein
MEVSDITIDVLYKNGISFYYNESYKEATTSFTQVIERDISFMDYKSLAYPIN